MEITYSPVNEGRSESVWVYVLQSETTDRLYVGITADLRRRMAEHNGGHSRSTCAGQPWCIVHKESFQNHTSARVREKFLKSGQGREWLSGVLSQKSAPAVGG